MMGNLQSQTQVESESSEDEDFLPATGMENDQNISTDGLPIRPITTLSIQNVLDIEKELDFNEKVSMAYLLYDDFDLALKYLIQLQNGISINILHKWALQMGNTQWNWKILEALAVIQNFKLLHLYGGYSIVEANQIFLPLNRHTSIEIDLAKKKLYRLAEDFRSDQLQTLLGLVKKDFKDKKREFKTFAGDFLEMYLLYWCSIKYISPSNFTNLAKIFKQMEMFEISEYLKTFDRPLERLSSSPSDRRVDATFLDDASDILLNRSISSSSSVNTHIRINSYCSYRMNENAPGVCLIINQEIFYTEPEPSLQELVPNNGRMLETREGTNVDCARIKNTMDKFGFRTVVRDNLDHIGVIKTVQSTVKEVTEDDSCLIICILSHGLQGQIYGNNSIPIEVSHIKKIMCQTNVNNLAGKPKILIIQACQGTECQEVMKYEDNDDIEMDSPRAILNPTPKSADMLVFWATVPGYGAIRDKKKGTWFIQSLCDKLEQSAADTHFEDICTMVIQDVIHKRWDKKAMVPIKESTLSASLFLPKMQCL